MDDVFSYRQEVYRKLIHLSSLWMPAVVYFFSKPIAAGVFAAGLVVVLLYEWLRRQPNALGAVLRRIFGVTLRDKELAPGLHFTGATYMLLAALLVTLIFPAQVAIAALSIMLVGDTAAALVGRRYGHIKILDKSLEGTEAFFISSVVIIFWISYLADYNARFFLAGLVASFVAAITELCGRVLRVDDNLTITLAAACTLWVML